MRNNFKIARSFVATVRPAAGSALNYASLQEGIGPYGFFDVVAWDDNDVQLDFPVTVSAIGGPQDYSGHSGLFKAAFEDLIGSTIPGTGFSDITVVPEPSGFLLFALAGLGFARRRRQR
jgi:hypothetical protein